jgi:hypothetical protein
MYQKGNLWREYRQYLFTSYRETELHLENCCLQRARRALQGMNNPLRGRKGELCLLMMRLWLFKFHSV